MNLRHRPSRRALGLAVAGLTLAGAAAFADTSSVPVTLGVVNGARTLQVTGVDGGVPAGPAALAFGPNATSAPLGVVVADLMYERTGYQVDATLSDLFRVDEDSGSVDCDVEVPAGAFSLAIGDPLDATGVDAVVEPLLTFEAADVSGDLLDLLTLEHLTELLDLGVSVPDTLPVTVADVPGTVGHLRDLAGDAMDGLEFMDVAQGAGGVFSGAAAHPACAGSADASPTSLLVQDATEATPDAASWDTLTAAVFDAAAATTTLTVAEAESHGLLPVNADQAGGILWQATESALAQALADAGFPESIVDDVLTDLTGATIGQLGATVTDLVLDLVGQTGAYPSVATLDLDTEEIGDAPTGLYHGVMTVTLLDK